MTCLNDGAEMPGVDLLSSAPWGRGPRGQGAGLASDEGAAPGDRLGSLEVSDGPWTDQKVAVGEEWGVV